MLRPTNHDLLDVRGPRPWCARGAGGYPLCPPGRSLGTYTLERTCPGRQRSLRGGRQCRIVLEACALRAPLPATRLTPLGSPSVGGLELWGKDIRPDL